MATVRELAIKVTGDSTSYANEMNRASRTGTQFYKGMEERSRRFDAYIAKNGNSIEAINSKLTSLGRNAKVALGSLAGGFAASSAIKMADDYGQMAIRVKMALQSASGSVEQFKEVQDQLFEMSQINSRDLSQAQALYIQSASGMKELGLSTDQTLGVIRTLNNEFTISATSAQSTESAINALSKAMMKGKVGTDELMSIMKAMPSLMTHIASNMKISESALKNMIVNNQLPLSELLLQIAELKDKTTEMAKEMPNTVADGLQQVSNAMSHYLGEVNESNQVTANLSAGLGILANNFNSVANAAMVLTGIGVARWAGLAAQAKWSAVNASMAKSKGLRVEIATEREKITTQLQSITTEKAQLEVQKQNILIAQAHSSSMRAQNSLSKQLIAVENQLTATRNAEAQATARLATANRSLSLASRAGSGLLGVMGGPVGLIATVGVLAASFIDLSSDADKASKSLADMSLPVDDLIDKYKKLDSLNKSVFKNEVASNVSDKIKEITDNTEKTKEAALKYLSTTQSYSGGGVSGHVTGIFDKDKKAEFEQYIKQVDILAKKAQKAEINQFELAEGVIRFTEILSKNTGMTKEQTDSLIKLASGAATASGELQKAQDLAIALNEIDNFVGPPEPSKVVITQSNDLVKAYENQLNLLNRQIESYDKLTVQAKVLKAIEDGSLNGLLPEQIELLHEKIDLINQLEAKQKAEREHLEAVKKAQAEAEAQRKKAQDEQNERQREYNNLVLSLRTVEQVQFDEYKEKYELIQKMAKSEAERLENMRKLAEQTVSKAPSSAMSSYTGIGSDMINVATKDKDLDDWRASELKKQEGFYKKSLILKQEHDNNVAKIEEQFRKTKEENESAMQMATLGVFSSMTGDIAEMFKATAGESSAAYKIMFAASKAAAIAQMIISTEVAAGKARELGSFAGIAAESWVRGLGYASIGLISAQTITGMAHDGIDSIPREGTWLLDKGERVVDARTNADLKDFIKSNKSGGNLTITVPVNIGDGSVSDQDGQQLGQMIKQSVINVIEEQQRPGGILNKR